MLSSFYSQNKAEIKNGSLAYSITTNKYTPLHTGILIFPNWIIIHFQCDLSYLQNGKLPKYVKSVDMTVPKSNIWHCTEQYSSTLVLLYFF